MSDHPEPSRGVRILVADDEPHIRRVLSTMLDRGGFDVAEASDGSRALELFQADQPPFDFVLLDLMMPGATGLEVLAKIRADESRGSTPVIILTAKGQDTDRDAAIAGGANDFMTKPFSPKKLLARIRELLDDA